MPEQIVYLRGDFQQSGFRVLSNPDVVESARALLALDSVVVDNLAGALVSEPGFLDLEALVELVHKHVGNADQARSIARCLSSLERGWRESGLPIQEFAKRLPDLIPPANVSDKKADATKPLSRAEAEELGRRIVVMFRSGSALERQHKAERLFRATGKPLESLQLICDLRPVFDDERVQIAGMVPITTLRIVVTDTDGLPVALEASLSIQQIEDLQSKATLALLKLKTLKDLLVKKGITQPMVERAPEGRGN